MTRRRGLLGVIALSLALVQTTALRAQGQPQMTLDEAVAAGYLTQADVDRVEGRMAATGEQMTRVLERDLPQIRNTLDNRTDGLAVDLAPFLSDDALRRAGVTDRDAYLNDPEFARKTAEGIVSGYKTMLEVERTAGNTVRPLLQQVVNEQAAAQQDLADALSRNGAPPALVAQQQAAANDIRQRGVPALERKLNEHDANIREAERLIREREGELIQRTTQAIKEAQTRYGNDPRSWPQGAVPNTLPRTGTSYLDVVAPPRVVGGPGYLPGQIAGMPGTGFGSTPTVTPTPAPTPAPAPGGTAQPVAGGSSTTPSPAPAVTAGGTPRPVQRGTIPGQGDPYEGFRVPANQGGTGPAQPGSTRPPQPRPAQTAQPKPSPAPATPTPPPPTLEIPPTKLPDDRPDPGDSDGTEGLGLARSPVTADGGSGRDPRPGAPVQPGGTTPSMDVQKVPPPVQTDQFILTPGGPVNISKLMRDARNPGQTRDSPNPDTTPAKPLTQAQLAEIKRIMDTLPKNKDGSIDLEAGLKSLVGGAGDWFKELLDPPADTPPGATDAAKQPVKTTAAAQKPREPFVQPRQPGGPDYPLAPPRSPQAPRQSAPYALWMGGDAFMNAAMVAYLAEAAAGPPDAVDISRAAIDQRLADALAAWDRLADEVWYDEDGVIHRVPKDRPVNEYVKPPTPKRPIDDSVWGRFERGEGSLSVLELEAIYAGYDIDNMPIGSSGRSLSAAGQSLSAAPQSLKIDWHLPGAGDSVAQVALDRAMGNLARGAADMGLPINWGGLDLASNPIRVSASALPPAGSYADLLRLTTQGGGFNPNNPFGLPGRSGTPVLCGR